MKYLELLEKGNITPNFWCAEEYFEKAGLIEISEEINFIDTISVEDDPHILVFPSINRDNLLCYFHPFVWSDFPEWKPNNSWKPQFLDLEYIYDPKSFLHMDGGDWAVFRKNCRKWPRRFGNGNLRYDWVTSLLSPFQKDELSNVLSSWLESKSPEDKIMDDNVLVEYLFNGQNRKILYYKNKIYGINIWDENYKYINFRYSVCRPEEFLSERMRLLFYTDPLILNSGKLVNDGGVLDNPNLKRFKDKLCPLHVREVFSWNKS